MGRAAAHSDEFARWRRRFQAEMAAHYGEEFAAECIAEVDADVAFHGSQTPDDQRLLENVVPQLVLNRRKLRHG